jgi:hypothetical protein
MLNGRWIVALRDLVGVEIQLDGNRVRPCPVAVRGSRVIFELFHGEPRRQVPPTRVLVAELHGVGENLMQVIATNKHVQLEPGKHGTIGITPATHRLRTQRNPSKLAIDGAKLRRDGITTTKWKLDDLPTRPIA